MTAFTLKIIALLAMLTDHIGEVYALSIPNAFLLRMIGRLAFPLYAYMIAEGCRHTSNIKKYALRLGVFALISEIPFDLCFENAGISGIGELTFLSFDYQNVFFNLCLAVTAVYAWERAKESGHRLLGAAAFAAATITAALLRADYTYYAVPLIACLYFARDKKIQAAAMGVFAALLYLPGYNYRVLLFGHRLPGGLLAFLTALIPAVLILFYNGRRGPKVRYFFYACYPLHLIVLAALQILSVI